MFDAALASVRAEALLHATNALLRSADLTELAHAIADATRSLFAPSDVLVVFRDPTGVPAVFAADSTRLDGSTLVEALGTDILERGFDGDELSTDDAGSRGVPRTDRCVRRPVRHGAPDPDLVDSGGDPVRALR